jgi:hypothetical protein
VERQGTHACSSCRPGCYDYRNGKWLIGKSIHSCVWLHLPGMGTKQPLATHVTSIHSGRKCQLTRCNTRPRMS